MKIWTSICLTVVCAVSFLSGSRVVAQGMRVPSRTVNNSVSTSTQHTAPATAPIVAAGFAGPSSLNAAAAGNSQIDLSWTAVAPVGSSTVIRYRIERCEGSGCATFQQVDTAVATTYRDSGLSSLANYSYRVRAEDAAGNLSAYSAVASMQAPAAAAPPTGLTLTGPSGLAAAITATVQIGLSWTAATESVGTVTTYHIERCQGQSCSNYVQIATSPSPSFTDSSIVPTQTYWYRVRGTDGSGYPTSYSNTVSIAFPPTSAGLFGPCWLFPTRRSCMSFGSDLDANINTFYGTAGTLSYFGQIKSIYNGASGAATVGADLATLNFVNGMQVTVGTNVQAGAAGATVANSAQTPTLSSNGAAQAAQNMLYGGTFVVSALYPLVAIKASRPNNPDNLGILIDIIGKEGADLQNFKSGTNVNVTAPPSHTSAHVEGYLQYNSTHLASSASEYTGAIFVGGSYGYDYTSHGYARDYGFGGRVQNDLGQVSVGVLINGVARIVVSRAFGPKQTYYDSTSTSTSPVVVNNFKAWSFGITYQSPSPTSK